MSRRGTLCLCRDSVAPLDSGGQSDSGDSPAGHSCGAVIAVIDAVGAVCPAGDNAGVASRWLGLACRYLRRDTVSFIAVVVVDEPNLLMQLDGSLGEAEEAVLIGAGGCEWMQAAAVLGLVPADAPVHSLNACFSTPPSLPALKSAIVRVSRIVVPRTWHLCRRGVMWARRQFRCGVTTRRRPACWSGGGGRQARATARSRRQR